MCTTLSKKGNCGNSTVISAALDKSTWSNNNGQNTRYRNSTCGIATGFISKRDNRRKHTYRSSWGNTMVKTTASVVMTKTSSKNCTYSVSTGNAAHCPDTNGTWRSTTTGENNLSRNCTSREWSKPCMTLGNTGLPTMKGNTAWKQQRRPWWTASVKNISCNCGTASARHRVVQMSVEKTSTVWTKTTRRHNTGNGTPRATEPKGALTTSRKGASTCLSGETCARNFADIFYTASGLRAE